jgi:hypothetical protein
MCSISLSFLTSTYDISLKSELYTVIYHSERRGLVSGSRIYAKLLQMLNEQINYFEIEDLVFKKSI